MCKEYVLRVCGILSIPLVEIEREQYRFVIPEKYRDFFTQREMTISFVPSHDARVVHVTRGSYLLQQLSSLLLEVAKGTSFGTVKSENSRLFSSSGTYLLMWFRCKLPGHQEAFRGFCYPFDGGEVRPFFQRDFLQEVIEEASFRRPNKDLVCLAIEGVTKVAERHFMHLQRVKGYEQLPQLEEEIERIGRYYDLLFQERGSAETDQHLTEEQNRLIEMQKRKYDDGKTGVWLEPFHLLFLRSV